MPLVDRVRASLLGNWPIKLTALVLATVLWAVVAADEPSIQTMTIPLSVQMPEGRSLTAQPPPVEVVFAGAARELLKLYATQPVLRKSVPDSLEDSTYVLQLSPADVDIPKNVSARTQDVRPRRIVLGIEGVVPRVAAQAESTGAVSERVLMGVPVVVRDPGGFSWSSDPFAVMVIVRGPAPRVGRLTRDSVVVSAVPAGSGRSETVRLEVLTPNGIEGTVTPDTAVVQRRVRG